MYRISLTTLCLLAFSSAAFADHNLACWNTHNARGARPALTATLTSTTDGPKLHNVCLNSNDPILKQYNYELSNGDSSELDKRCTELVGAIKIENKRSPYIDNSEYSLLIGKAKDKSGKVMNDYLARVILPTDLSPNKLKGFRFAHRKTERLNGVMIIDPPHHNGQTGDSYISLFCQTQVSRH